MSKVLLKKVRLDIVTTFEALKTITEHDSFP